MDPYSILSLFLKATGYLLLGLLLVFCYKFVLVPLNKLRFYSKQGLSSYFFPLLGFIKRDKQIEKVTGDFMGYYKQLPETKPDLRAIVDSFASRVDVLLFDPKLIKEFFHNQHLYKKHSTAKIMKALSPTGLVTAEDAMWKKHRKVVSSVFHYEFLRESVPSIISTTRDFLNKITENSMTKVDILSQSQTITSGVIGKLFFSENLNQYSIRGKSLPLFLVDILFNAIAIFRKPLPIIMIVTGCNMERLASYRQLMADIMEFREICCKIVKERKNSNLTRTGPKSHDLLEFLLDAQNAANVEDQFTDEEIVDEFITFFLGGMDSTAHLVSMTLYLLSVYPEYLKKVQDEINEHCNKGVYDIGAINNLEFLHCMLKETLRMYAPAPGMTSRQAQADHNLLDLKIKKGDFVKPTPFYNYFNEKYFEDPKVFKPERWLNKKENNLDPFVFIPFSAGPRNCIGQHLAVLEAKIIVAEFVMKFKFRSQENYELKMTLGSLYEPKEKVLLDLELI